MELIFNARQLSRCPELPAGHGNYACWQKSTASSSEQRRNSRLQDGKTMEGLQTRSDPVYEPMSVSRILCLGQKESRWTPQQKSSGIRFYRFLMRSSQISRRILRSVLLQNLDFSTVGFSHLNHSVHIYSCIFLRQCFDVKIIPYLMKVLYHPLNFHIISSLIVKLQILYKS